MARKKSRKSKAGRPRKAGGETGRMLDRAELYNAKVECCVCDSHVPTIHAEKVPYDLEYTDDNPRRWRCKTCAPGSYNWLIFNPSEIAFQLYLGDKTKKGGGIRDRFNQYLEEKGITEEQFFNNNDIAFRKHLIKFLKWEKGRKKVMAKKGKKGSGLKPKKAVEVPASLKKHPDIGPHIKVLLSEDRSGTEAASARKALRNMGFKLSDESTWKPFLKGKRVKTEKKEKAEKPAKSEKKKSKKDKEEKSSKKKSSKKKSKKKKTKKEEKAPSKKKAKKKKLNLEDDE
jgi:hypothetical protein